MGSRLHELTLLHWLAIAAPVIAAAITAFVVDRLLLKNPRPTWKQTLQSHLLPFSFLRSENETRRVFIVGGAGFVALVLTFVAIELFGRSLR